MESHDYPRYINDYDDPEIKDGKGKSILNEFPDQMQRYRQLCYSLIRKAMKMILRQDLCIFDNHFKRFVIEELIRNWASILFILYTLQISAHGPTGGELDFNLLTRSYGPYVRILMELRRCH